MSSILTPPRVFLDTWLLSDMLRVQEGDDLPNDYDGSLARACRYLHKWLQSGAITAVFCEFLIGEWIQHRDDNRAFQYAKILDSAHHLLEFPPGPCGIVLAEALNECGRMHPELGLPQFEILRYPCPGCDDSLLNFFALHHPSSKNHTHDALDKQYPPAPPPNSSVERKVKCYLYAKSQNPELLEQGVDGDEIAFNVTKKTQAEVSSTSELFGKAFIKNWILDALQLDAVLHSACPGKNPKNIVDQIDLQCCPGTLLYYHQYNKYVRANEKYNKQKNHTDFVDQAYIPGLAYCDFATVDKRVREFIRQAQRDLNVSKPVVFNDIQELVKCIAPRIGEEG